MKNVIGIFAIALMMGVVGMGNGSAGAQTTPTQSVINVGEPGTSGKGYAVAEHVITIYANGDYVLQGTTTVNRVVIGAGVSAVLRLQVVSITSSGGSPLELGNGASVNLVLMRNNVLKCAIANDIKLYCAGLQVAESSRVVIYGDGSLDVTGGFGGAGIGSGAVEETGVAAGTIIIRNGTINAVGGSRGAGIGGGRNGSGGSISILGGTVTAQSNDYGAGIGGGYQGAGGTISISGGNVASKSGDYGSGIGGGYQAAGGTISISGGNVTAEGGMGAAIGGGSEAEGGNITISGGVVHAIGSNMDNGPAGIGGGQGSAGKAGRINITGGNVYAFGRSGPGIGGGSGASGGSIIIEGGSVVANSLGLGRWHNEAGDFGVTQIAVSGGSVLTDTMANNVAGVVTGAKITEELIASLVANAPKVPASNINSEATFSYETVTTRDTVINTQIVHDTTLSIVRDSVHLELPLHDTLRITLRDTFVTTRIVYDTLEISVPYEVVTVIDLLTGEETLVENELQLLPTDTPNTYRLVGLTTTGQNFALFDSDGMLIYRGTDTTIYLPESGTFVVVQSGKYWKFSK